MVIWVVLLLGVLARAEDPAEEGGVLVLTDNNFKDTIKGLEYVLVEFYAPWCGHCKALAPEYEKAAGMLKEKDSSIRLAKVDATVEKALAKEYAIQGFPTLKLFKSDGEPMDYTGGRDANGIVAWLDKKTGPPCTEISDEKSLETLTNEENVLIGGFFDDVTSKNAKLFEDLAKKDERHKYVFITGKEITAKHEARDSTIIVFRNFDEGNVVYRGKYVASDIDAFILQASRPDIFEFSQENSEKIFGSGVHNFVLILSSRKDKLYDTQIEQVRPVAKDNKLRIIFVHIDTADDEYQDILEFLGVKKDDLPTFIMFDMRSSKKYPPQNKDITTDNLRSFVKDFLAGKLKPVLKSAELPEDWDSQPVKVLVSSNFNEVAMNAEKDVFVEFYAPWCGHCKNLAPVWDKLGEHFKERSDIVVAKMDATENELEEVSIDSFPTLKLVKKETNEIVDYIGKRDFDSMVKFLETGEQPELDQSEEGEEGEESADDYDDYEDYEDDDDEGEDSGEEVRPKDEL